MLAVIELGGEIYEKRNENMYWGLLGAFSSAHSASRLKSHLKRLLNQSFITFFFAINII